MCLPRSPKIVVGGTGVSAGVYADNAAFRRYLRTAWKAIHAMDPNLFAQAAVIPLFADHRILCQVAGHNQATLKLIPPLTVSEADVDEFLRAFRAVLQGMHRFPGPAFDILRRLGTNAVTRRSYEEAVAEAELTTA